MKYNPYKKLVKGLDQDGWRGTLCSLYLAMIVLFAVFWIVVLFIILFLWNVTLGIITVGFLLNVWYHEATKKVT